MRFRRYRLSLDVDPPHRRFEGRVEIELETSESTLRLHAVDLEVRSATVDGRPAAFGTNAAAQEVTVETGPPGSRVVALAYAGRVLPDGLTGMYVSPYGPGAEVLTTQMYPTGARRLFPCRDEPAEKAEFDVTVRVPKEARVVFNTDPAESREEDAARVVRFRTTPRMSTYLLYLGIGPFEETERLDPGLRTIVAHPAGRAEAARFALEHASRFVRAYAEYYAIDYPLPKLHLVAVPSFWAGAMENWGAIAFRETTLLVDAQTGTFARRWNRQVLAHEIAHQWFGNLVTNAWWSDFWLNEAFANFVANRILDRVHPGESTWEDFVTVEMGKGLTQDCLDSAHPIVVEIRRPEEIGEIADGITYGKGASLLRMIESYVGEPAFRAGVTAYLKAHEYGAASSADLWSALDRHTDAPVSRIMEAWVRRPGHPIVDVRRSGDALEFTQRRFRYGGPGPSEPWPLPLEVEVGTERVKRLHDGGTVRIPAPRGAPLRVNPDRPGFFHVRYDAELSRELLDRWSELTEIDQWGVLTDRNHFLASGDGTLDEYLEVIDRIREHPRYLPSLSAARQLRTFTPFLARVPRLARTHRAFFESEFQRLGPSRRPGEPPATGTLRGVVALGLLDASPERARELGEGYRDREAELDPDLLDVATIAYARTGGREAWTTIRARLPDAPSDEAAGRLAVALGQTPDPESYQETLRLLAGTELTASRVYDVLVVGRFNLAGAAALWDWYETHLPHLEARWKGTPLLSLLLPEGLAWTGLGRGPRVRAYFAAHAFPEADRGVREGLERLAVRERLAERLLAERPRATTPAA